LSGNKSRRESLCSSGPTGFESLRGDAELLVVVVSPLLGHRQPTHSERSSINVSKRMPRRDTHGAESTSAARRSGSAPRSSQ
jgi:hypothetical protein